MLLPPWRGKVGMGGSAGPIGKALLILRLVREPALQTRHLIRFTSRSVTCSQMVAHFLFAGQFSERVREAKMLNEQVMLRVDVNRTHRGFEVK